jgi:phosphoadenosine phosphosulfate reductase
MFDATVPADAPISSDAAPSSSAAEALLTAAITRDFRGAIALVSSFGAESAVLLHLVATVDPATPVLFLDTGRLFGETLRYRTLLAERLGLRDLRVLAPDPVALAALDPARTAWRDAPDACCGLRKVAPLRQGLAPFRAWISGRKRFHGGGRESLPLLETAEGRVKLNPLANWSPRQLADYMERHALPRHPLEAEGFRSIGCLPCTDRVRPEEEPRAGRWRGLDKTECGIHRPA